MVAVPSTSALGRFVELADLPRQRDGLGSDSLRLVLLKSVGGATDTVLRNCATFDDLLSAGAVECDFTGYTTGGKVLGSADRTITSVTGSSPYKNQVSITQQTWDPAGGATNNSPIKAVLLYRPTTSTALGDCQVLGMCDTSGSAAGGTYSVTFGTLTSQAA